MTISPSRITLNNWPQLYDLGGPRGTLLTNGDLYGNFAGIVLANTGTSTVWPAIDLAIFQLVCTPVPLTIAQLFVNNGAAIFGNIDVGLYALDGTRIVSSGSTAQSGASSMQVFNVTDTPIGPGAYYMAVALNTTTGTVAAQVLGSAQIGQLMGLAEQTSAFALPANATLATSTRLLAPFLGATIKTTI